jgi:hypothetical protein
MESAVERQPARDFVEPDVLPTYRYWHGDWQWSGSYSAPTDESSSGYTPPPPPAEPPPPPPPAEPPPDNG